MKPLNLIALGFVLALIPAVATARAGWTPSEASVTPPAVVTLDTFGTTGGKGANPNGPLVVGGDGALYGATGNGGTNGAGTVFRVTTGGTFAKLADEGPPGPVVLGPNGTLYWTGEYPTFSGDDGLEFEPTLFSLATNGVYVGFQAFALPEAPGLGAVVLGPDGALYVAYQGSGLYLGAVYRVAPSGQTTTLHYFDPFGSGTNGSGPDGLLVGPDGALYGSTIIGGASNQGALYRLTTGGAFTRLHDFNGTDGRGPATMVAGLDGALYGKTDSGGTSNQGVLFRLTTGGTFSKLHDFNGPDGSGSSGLSPLVAGSDGALYGSTWSGGTSNQGTLFRLTTGGTFTKLHDFSGTDGSGSGGLSPLVAGPDGALYGSTWSGGTSNQGTLFRLTTGGAFTKLHDFNGTNGAGPGALVVGPDHALYGSTYSGGPQGVGLLFKLVLERAPVVSIARSNAFVIVSWPVTSLNLQPQQSPDLSLPNSWSSVAQPAVTNSGQVSVTVPMTAGRRFFRLTSQ